MSPVLPSATAAADEHGAPPGTVPKVFVTSHPPRHIIDYVDELVGDDSEGRAPRGALLQYGTDPSRARGIDVIHLTDVTTIFGGTHSSERERVRRAKRFAKMLRSRRIALVRTVHGDEVTRAPSRAEAILNDAAASVIALSSVASTSREALVIEHSHLRDRFLGFPHEQRMPGRMLITGGPELHPTYEKVLKVFGVAELEGWTLRAAGPVPPELEDSYARTLAEHDTVSLRNELLSDAARVAEITQAEIVVVTATETYPAQSTLLLALSLDRPVLVEDTAQTRALADEVGASWVRRHSGPLTGHTLEQALATLRAEPPVGRPNLELRAPNEISARYIAVYRQAADGR